MSLAATLTQSLRSKYGQELDKNQVRESIYGMTRLFKQDTDSVMSILSAEVKENVKKSFGNSGGVVIPVMDATTVTIGNTRSCTVADAENDSALVTLTFITYSFAFSMTPAQHFNNDVKYQEDFDRKLFAGLVELADTIEAQTVNTAETDKNQFFPAEILNYYAEVGDALQVPQAEKDDFYNQMSAIMRQMNFGSMGLGYNVAHSISHEPLVNRFTNQGAGNDQNQQFQFAGYTFFSSSEIANNAGVESTVYVSTQGTYAMENRNDPDCVQGRSIGDTNNPHKEWSEQLLPIVDMEMGVYYTADCNDDAAKGGGANTRNFKEGWEFSTDVAYITAYNSDPVNTFTPIVKAEILQ